MTPDQRSLVELADEILRSRTSNEQLAVVESSETRFDEKLWAELAGAGLVGIAVPEEYGGAGLGLAEICLLLEQVGRRVGPVPLWECAVAALALTRFGTDEQRGAWLPAVAAGTAVLTVAVDLGASGGSTASPGGDGGDLAVNGSALDGLAPMVPSGLYADAVLVVRADGLWLAPLADVRRTPVETTTHALAADLAFDGTPAVRLDGDADWVRDVARLGLAAGQLGNTDEGVREAASYLSQREQFGRPLATFQAVSQQLGDAYCDVQAMRATLWQAVWALEQSAKDGRAARREVDVATWWACDAGVRVQTVVQHLHGGIGADTTYPVHRRLLWALRTDALLGGATRQLARLGPALL
ncbi:MAG: 3-oxocholest-4-en-26-oyl-CoA dehydrogenase beta subunit [Pseudonocardiales bacterium]|nr:3-oxocholest-4-en-26-oyl-CoA dehydrogenase beta subunit [Pseudonocardiales bacterium]